MGLELKCTARLGRRSSEGKALLETHELLFRGRFRLAIPFDQMRAVKADGGQLIIATPDGTAVFEIGTAAEKWASRILHPPTLLAKLGIKGDLKVSTIGVRDSTFLEQLRSQIREVHPVRPARNSDLVFLAANDRTDLRKLPICKAHLKPDGAIWVIRPKGSQLITEGEVLAAGRSFGLVDVKVVSFSNTHTAEKFVIPLNSRRDQT